MLGGRSPATSRWAHVRLWIAAHDGDGSRKRCSQRLLLSCGLSNQPEDPPASSENPAPFVPTARNARVGNHLRRQSPAA